MKDECVFLKMGIKKEAPSLFCFGSHQALPTAQCSDGALIRFDLAHIIEVECVIGLDYQLVLPVLLDVKGVPLVVVGELPVLWMLRNVVFVTEKRSHASKLQNTLGSVHDGDLILRHQFLAGLLIVQAIGVVVGTGFRGVVKVDCLLAQHLADFLERGFLLAAEEKCAVAVARDGVSRILVDGFELRLGLQDD